MNGDEAMKLFEKGYNEAARVTKALPIHHVATGDRRCMKAGVLVVLDEIAR